MTDIVERLLARLQRDRHGNLDPDLSIKIGPGIYEEIMAAAAEIDRLRAASEWRDISTAPKLSDQNVIPACFVWVEGGGEDGKGASAFGFAYRADDGQVRARANGYWGDYKITHFRPMFDRPPLPAPPQRNEVTK